MWYLEPNVDGVRPRSSETPHIDFPDEHTIMSINTYINIGMVASYHVY